MRSLSLTIAALGTLLATLGATIPLYAQPAPSGSGTAVNLTVRKVGLSIGDSKWTTGIRLNYRDRRLRRVTGINFTLWAPHDDAGGTVNGIALGLPLTGGDRLWGLGVGAGLSARTAMDGLFFAPVGLGSGQRLSGIAVGGLGLGAGEHAKGLLIGGLGAGAGEDADGLLVAGVGAGAGGTTNGVLIGGLGAGAGEQANGVLLSALGTGAGGSVNGLLVGGAAAGAGGSATGILIGGLGAGAGDRATGLFVGGLGAGAGDTVNGIALSVGGVGAGSQLNGIGVGGVGVGSGQSINGLAVSGLGVGSSSVTGLALGGAYSRIEDGVLRGLSVSAYNDIRGTQRGVTIGIYNYTRELHGAQIGLLNFARNNPVWAKLLPVLNLNL